MKVWRLLSGMAGGQFPPAVAPAPKDPYFSSVALLLHMDGDSVDVKGNIFNSSGSASWGAGLFGQALLVNTGDSGLVAATSIPNLGFEQGDFTVELYAAPTVTENSGQAIIAHFDLGISDAGWEIYLDDQGKLNWYVYSSDRGGSYLATSAVSIRDGKFHHIAITRSSGSLQMWIDGNLAAGPVTDVRIYGYKGIQLSVGYQAQGLARYPFRGRIDDLRVTKGVARYTAKFTPPTAAFPDN